jgi:peptidoglycan hydrolase-like protein with peptidoglycan-binding domain
MARLVDGLESLRAEFNTINPKRDRSSDGWIGDDRHAATVSDHNPDVRGDVYAIDVDVDGVPMPAIVAWLVAECRAGRETRLQYVIFRRTIWSRSWGWKARAYRGANPHTKHAHFSARRELGRRGGGWGIAVKFKLGKPASKPPASKPGKVAAHPAGSRILLLRQPAMSGADVAYLQRWIGPRAGFTDGQYGPRTFVAVKWYQRMRGIAADGIVGPVTWRHLGVRYTGKT